MCTYLDAVMSGREYEVWIELVAKNNAKLDKKEVKVANRILMQCGGDQCEVTKEIGRNLGRPEGWFAVDVEGPGYEKKVSMVLCPGCFSALGIKVPTVTVTP